MYFPFRRGVRSRAKGEAPRGGGSCSQGGIHIYSYSPLEDVMLGVARGLNLQIVGATVGNFCQNSLYLSGLCGLYALVGVWGWGLGGSGGAKTTKLTVNRRK